jgi:flavin-dependent dehydrogenase
MVYARLVADCSGKEAVVRRALRKPTPVEDFEIGPRDSMYVILKFLKLKYPERDAPRRAEHWAYYKGWVGQSQSPDVAIIGTGAALSFEYAEKCMERFLSAVEMPEGEIIEERRGSLPYRRPPYSLVDSGFVALGDAACMNKWVGEGICSAWVGCQMAAEVAGKAMRGGAYPTLEALWPLNVRYNTTQQADFAYINATAVNAVDCGAAEMEYEFEKGIVFTDKAMTRLNWTYSAEMPPDEVAQLVAKMAAGLASGRISPRTLKNMLKGVACSTLLKAHYRAFPKTPEGFGDWADSCDRLWETCGNIADITEKCEMRMQNAEIPV